MSTKKLTNWGNYPEIEANLIGFSTEYELKNLIVNLNELIPRGLGRCYGDSALNQKVVSTLKFNRILNFNDTNGTVTCESGVSLEDLIKTFLSKGWFLPVTPGTKFITIGGAIASDVHGKNHHIEGSLSNHLISMDIMLADGSVSSCSKEHNPELFWATCGGMGLTGVILRASFKLSKIETSYISQNTIKARNIDDIMKIFDDSKNYTYSVAWIDCLARKNKLGRSIMMRGEHTKLEEIKHHENIKDPLTHSNKTKLDIPVFFPNIALNMLSVKGFNFLYYNKQIQKQMNSIINYDKFFYPLDSINNWNRIYGKRGFTQYQFVLPKDESYDGLIKILTKISKSGSCSFLAVLKLFGKQNDLISFPKEGYTLALDFPVKPGVLKLLNDLDEIVLEHHGRLYLTKDARMSAETFKKGYENLEKFKEVKSKIDPEKKFQSCQSKRIGI